MPTETAPDKLSIVVYDHHYDKVHYALVMASAAAAIGKPVTLFFTMGACQALMGEQGDVLPGWSQMPVSDSTKTGQQCDRDYRKGGIGTFEELLEACHAFGVKFMVCEMGLRAKGFDGRQLRTDIEIEVSGVVTFLHDASKDGAVLFI